MGDFWKADSYITDMVNELIANFHPQISNANISIWLKESASKSELETGLIVSAKKVPPLYKTITDLDFVFVIAQDEWSELSEAEKNIKLDSALTCCRVKIDPETDEEKLSPDGSPIYELKKPDLVEFVSIVERYGLDAISQVETKIRSLLQSPPEGEDNRKEVVVEQSIPEEGTTRTRKSKKADAAV